MKVKHKIDAVELVDEIGRVIRMELIIDNLIFELDQADVWNLYTLCETVFNKMEKKGLVNTV